MKLFSSLGPMWTSLSLLGIYCINTHFPWLILGHSGKLRTKLVLGIYVLLLRIWAATDLMMAQVPNNISPAEVNVNNLEIPVQAPPPVLGAAAIGDDTGQQAPQVQHREVAEQNAVSSFSFHFLFITFPLSLTKSASGVFLILLRVILQGIPVKSDSTVDLGKKILERKDS